MEQVTKTCVRLGIKPAARILVVRLGRQTMQFTFDFHWQEGAKP